MSANVNKPTNNAVKEADINRKLQVYGIATAFQNGKVPSNDQIDVALSSFLASKAFSSPSGDLSDDGKNLIKDTRDVIQQAKYLLLSKNEGNLIQDFVWQTTQFDPKSVNTPNAPVTKDAAKKDGEDALQGLRTLGTLLITNGQFRKLLKDATVLLRDIAGDAATNAASRVRPSEEQLANMDQAAQDNTWHEKPDFSKENLKKQAQGVYGGNAKKDAKDTVNAGLQANQQQGDTAAGANVALNTAKEKLDGKLDDKTKKNILQRNEDLRRQASDYYSKKMPQERKDQTIFRLKKMVLECQQHEDYSQAIQTLLNLAENYGRHGRTMGKGGASSAKEARSGFAAAEADLRTLIERFANGTSTSDLWESIGQIYKDAEKDPELREWFKNLDAYIRRCLLQQGFILDDASNQQWNQLYERGRYLLREKYRSHTNRIVDEIKFVADQFDKDAQNKAFAQSLTKLFKDLGQDADGKPVFKPHLIKDLTEVILPSVLKNIAYIPIPRIEFSDPKFDAIIENLVLESDNFMPNVLEIASEHYFRWGRKKIANKHHQTFEVKAAGIQMDLRDVSFHIKRKQGFPSITDTGVMDLLLPGDGFSFKMKVSTAHKKDRQNFFKVEKVDVDFKGLNFKIKQSSHKLLFALAKPLALKFMRKPIQVAVEKAIKDQCNNFDAQLYKVKQEVDRATVEAKNDPQNAPNIYMRYYTAAQNEFGKKKAKAEEAVADKKVKVAFTKEDSIFPAINLPGGISTKATEYKELARKGEKWESPVFSIGSAAKSTDIPPAPKIQRKAHPVNTGNSAVNGQNLKGQNYNGLQDLNGPNRKPINEFGTEFTTNGLKVNNGPVYSGGQIV
ncbi:hypothetical protein EDB81DRAFT_61834 [Dactylonectria macrodidyma]|uniref:Uncharacterized protein n=1 Tax=Dactylonectria macrodidyma TaxID=307937 RepID=A0A9P9EM63_9HYPO|nr:hypothetical protein EDB81DRAFT_61834 [Dactylonectria macrodidyma]